MSVFIEEILAPLHEPARDVDEAMSVLTLVLAQIERRPLRSSERRTIQKDVMDYIKQNGVKQDCKLSQQFSQRMQYDYLPTVSTLGLSKSVIEQNSAAICLSPTEDTADTVTTSSNMLTATASDEGTQDGSGEISYPFSVNIPGKCFICTVQRSKSALWTSYRLFVEGYKPNCDVTTLMVKFPKPVMILAARKLKSGISNQFYIWRNGDSKNWKEKNADACLSKSSLCYIGRTMTTAADSYSYPANSSGSGSIKGGRGIAVSVLSKSIDKLIHITALLPRLPKGQEGTDAIDSAAVDAWLDSDDALLLEMLQSAVSKKAITAGSPGGNAVSPQSMTVLRSRPPRRVGGAPVQSVSSTKNKHMHTLAFSHDCRVRAPSRKNIVIEPSSWEGTVIDTTGEKFVSNGSSTSGTLAVSSVPNDSDVGINDDRNSNLWVESTVPSPNPMFQVMMIMMS
jgi:hypothetical protein